MNIFVYEPPRSSLLSNKTPDWGAGRTSRGRNDTAFALLQHSLSASRQVDCRVGIFFERQVILSCNCLGLVLSAYLASSSWYLHLHQCCNVFPICLAVWFYLLLVLILCTINNFQSHLILWEIFLLLWLKSFPQRWLFSADDEDEERYVLLSLLHVVSPINKTQIIFALFATVILLLSSNLITQWWRSPH